MFRGLMLGAIAVGLGVFGASLLRTESRLPGRRKETPADGATCAARTRSGAACSRPAEPGSDTCWQHG